MRRVPLPLRLFRFRTHLPLKRKPRRKRSQVVLREVNLQNQLNLWVQTANPMLSNTPNSGPAEDDLHPRHSFSGAQHSVYMGGVGSDSLDVKHSTGGVRGGSHCGHVLNVHSTAAGLRVSTYNIGLGFNGKIDLVLDRASRA